jgi:hypothetical protein
METHKVYDLDGSVLLDAANLVKDVREIEVNDPQILS